MRSTLVVLAALAFVPATFAQSATPPPELKVLDRLVGTWDEVMTNTATEWRPKAERWVSVTRREWAVGNRFLRMDGFWRPSHIEFVNFFTYDPVTKEYRSWYFDSTGGIPRGIWKGTWDEAAKTMSWSGTDEFGNKLAGTTKFIDDDTHEGTVQTTNSQGKVVLDLTVKTTRRKK
jgi:hypothetical protein